MSKQPNAVDVSIGARIRARRIELGFSQTDLADALGVTFQQVQKYEKGTNRVSGSRLQQVSDKLQAPVSFFFDGDGAPTVLEADHHDYVLLRQIAALGPQQRLYISKAVQSLLDANAAIAKAA